MFVEALFIIFAALFTLVASGPNLPPVALTKTGQVRGQLISISSSLQVYQFTGIPFAEPPVGARRFRKPVPKTPWQGTLDATVVPNVCPQLSSAVTFEPALANYSAVKANSPKGRQSEDCLYLNIWVPKSTFDKLTTSPDEPPPTLAVLVFIHGGAFSMGSTSIDLYNGTVLAAYNNIVVATVQYRLGSLGFAYLGNEQVPGNMGLWDQMEALKWLCENVGSFGGNCSETTISGESAGAASVTYHLLSPQSRRYFKRAIVESGSALASWANHSPETARSATNALLEQIASTGCQNFNDQSEISEKIACLRSADPLNLPMADVMVGLKGLAFGPVVDGDFVPRDPVKMLQVGDFYKAPLLIGANKDEGSMFLMVSADTKSFLPRLPATSNQAMIDGLNYTHYLQLLGAGFKIFMPGTDSSLLFSAVQYHYWPTRHEGFPVGREVVDAAVAAAGDYSLTCPTLTWMQMASAFGTMGSRIFAYYFSQRRSGHAWPAWTGVMHGDELPFVFGEPFAPYARGYGYSYDDKALSRVMMAYWANFIKFGDPNMRDTGTVNIAYGPLQHRPWPAYTGVECPFQIVEMNAVVQIYNYGPGIICGLKSRDCMFWDLFFPKLAEIVTKNSAGGRR